MGEWKPIESAPKDGKPILAWFSYSARFQGITEATGGVDLAYWTDHNGGGWVSYRSGTPTHWMPLPPAPVQPDRDPGQETPAE